jgi:hypothetical protein
VSAYAPMTESPGGLAGGIAIAGIRQGAQGDAEIDVGGLQRGGSLDVAGRYVVEHDDISGTLGLPSDVSGEVSREVYLAIVCSISRRLFWTCSIRLTRSETTAQ